MRLCYIWLSTAAGRYSDGVGLYPMLAQSTDEGSSWSYPIDKNSSLPVDYNAGNGFLGTNCSGTICIAGGTYSDGSVNYPMLAQTADGLIWSYKIEKNLSLPLDYDNSGSFDSTSCSGSLCIATGIYYETITAYPMLAQSADGGLTWSYKIEKNASLPLDFSAVSSFSNSSCSGTICTAGGSYYAGLDLYPMLVQSTDGGLTWSYKIEKNLSLPLDYDSSGNFLGTSCFGSSCVTGGTYSDGSVNYPMLAQTADGLTWSYKIEKNLSLPTDYNNLGVFTSVSCSGTTCIVSGRYLDGVTAYPMLAQSGDGGLTWSYKIEKNLSLPADYSSSGSFFSASANTNNFLPDSLSFIHSP